jgi:alkylhydroperoxidase family enzyme
MRKPDHALRSAEQALLAAIEQITLDHRLTEAEVVEILLKDAAQRAGMIVRTRNQGG